MLAPSWNQCAAGAGAVIGLSVAVAALGTAMMPPGWRLFSNHAEEVFISGLTIAALGLLGLVLSLGYGWRQHRAKKDRLTTGKPYPFEPEKSDRDFWGELAGHHPASLFSQMHGGLLLLEVVNQSKKAIRDATASLSFETAERRREPVNGLWVTQSPRFNSLGTKTSIPPGQSHILVLAVFLRDSARWLEFSADDFPPRYRFDNGATLNQHNRERVDLGADCHVAVNISSSEADRSECYRLYFNELRPSDTFDPWWFPKWSVAPPPTTAPAQSPPSSPESS